MVSTPSSDPILRAIATSLAQNRKWTNVAIYTSLANVLLLAMMCKFVFWPQAYITPPGGPGLVKAGVANDKTVKDYAQRWFLNRWNWKIDTYKQVQDAVLETIHPASAARVKAELEQDFRLIRDLKMSAQTSWVETQILSRKGEVVTVVVRGRRTLYIGGREEPEEPIEEKLVLTLWYENGEPTGLVAIPGPTKPGLKSSGS